MSFVGTMRSCGMNGGFHGEVSFMCRNIRPLFNVEPSATDDEIRNASLQFVRKISGFATPSHANAEPFARAVDEITSAARELIASLKTTATAHDRQTYAARVKARALRRVGSMPGR